MGFCPVSEFVRRDTSCDFSQHWHFRFFVFKDHLITYVLIFRAPSFSFSPYLENFTMDHYRGGQSAVSKPTAIASTKHMLCNGSLFMMKFK